MPNKPMDMAPGRSIEDHVRHLDRLIRAHIGVQPGISTSQIPHKYNPNDILTTLTTIGDVLYRDASGLQRLGITNSRVLYSTGSAPTWATVTSILDDIATTSGDMLYNAAGTISRLPKGAAGEILGMSGASPAWVGPSYISHTDLTDFTIDDHIQYALLAGRSGGQSFAGGTGSGDDLTLLSNNHATKGHIYFGTTAAFDETTGHFGIGTLTPISSDPIDVNVDVAANRRISIVNANTGNGAFASITAGSMNIQQASTNNTTSRFGETGAWQASAGNTTSAVLYGNVGDGPVITGVNNIARHFIPTIKNLTNNTTTDLVNFTMANLSSIAGCLDYAVEVFQTGVGAQIETGTVHFHCTHQGGVPGNNVATKHDNQQSLGAGTLTVTFTITAANPAVVQVNANSSLTPTTLKIGYIAKNFTSQAAVLA